MTNLLALADRVEKAEAGSRELDAEIWLATSPGATRKSTTVKSSKGLWPNYDIDETRDASGRLIIVPEFTASIDAAMSLVPEGHLWKVGYSRHVPHVAEVVDYQSHRGTFVAECDSNRAIALCAAVLRAIASNRSAS